MGIYFSRFDVAMTQLFLYRTDVNTGFQGAELTSVLIRTCTDSSGHEYIAVYEWYISLIHLIVGLCAYYGLRKIRDLLLAKQKTNEEGAS